MFIQRLRSAALLAVLLPVYACSGGGDGGGGSPTDPRPNPQPPSPPAQTWPVVYDVKTLASPYMPGTVYTTTGRCNVVFRSSLETATLTLMADNTATVEVRAWEEVPRSLNDPRDPCPGPVMQNRSGTRQATYTITGTGAARTLIVNVGATKFAEGTLGDTGFPTTLSLTVPGYTVYDYGKPFDPLATSTWAKK